MQIKPLENGFGAEVTGIDLSKFTSVEAADIYEAFLKYQLLVVRNQSLSPSEQVVFSEIFGELEWQENEKYAHPDHDKVLILSNEVRHDGTAVGVVDAGDFWHSDSSHHERPVKITILQSVKNPSRGGDTDFCNMHAAYEAMSADLKKRVEGRYGVHHISKALNPRVVISPDRPDAKDFYESKAKTAARVLQPIIRTHDETGKQALYVSPRFTIAIDQMEDSEAQPLLDELFSLMTDRRRPYHYRHKYRENDLIMWDNRCLTHRATGGYGLPDIRRMHRTTVVGDRCIYKPN